MTLRFSSTVASTLLLFCTLAPAQTEQPPANQLTLNASEYLEMRGLNVMLAHDYYPESHQGGVGIIQNGLRVATNGDLRLEPTPGQWQPTPVVGKRQIDRNTGEVSVRMTYPDESKNRKGFNPILYPDLKFGYVVRIRPEGQSFRIIVDLDEPLPADWIGKVGFNLELFPGYLFGKSFLLGDSLGVFPRQDNGPAASESPLKEDFTPAKHLDYELAPLGRGKILVVAPESEAQRMTIEAVQGGEIALYDGRAQHTNGWFVVRALARARSSGSSRRTLFRIFFRRPSSRFPRSATIRGNRRLPSSNWTKTRQICGPLRSSAQRRKAASRFSSAPERTGAAFFATAISSSISQRSRSLACTSSLTGTRSPLSSRSATPFSSGTSGSPPWNISYPLRCATCASTTATASGTTTVIWTTR
jgi:hypothetical protein